MKKIAVAAALLMTVPIGQPSEAGVRNDPRVAFWIDGDFAKVGWASYHSGSVRLNVFRQQAYRLTGAVKAVAWSPDGSHVAWYDSGTGSWRVVGNIKDVEYPLEFAVAPFSQVRDRGAWMWASDGDPRPGPLSMLDPSSSATPPETWWQANQEGLVRRKFLRNNRDISRYVAAITARQRSGGIAMVRPYRVVDECDTEVCPAGVEKRLVREYGQGYLARLTNSLRIGKSYGKFPAARHLAVSAGGSLLAAVNASSSRVRVYSLPGLGKIADYPAVQKAHVSISPGGHLAISGPDSTVIRNHRGAKLDVPAGVTWFRYAPCVGAGCSSLP